MSCYDKIWQSDSLIPPDLRDALKLAVKPLEDVPDAEKDWHPRADGLVLDLVHPSLYPLVYGRSMIHWQDRTRGEATKYALQNEYPVQYAEMQQRGFGSATPWSKLPEAVKDWSADHLLGWIIDTPKEEVDDFTWASKAKNALGTIFYGRWRGVCALFDSKVDTGNLCVARPPQETTVVSARFAWLPTDFLVGNTGVKAQGYINNIHPTNVPLVRAVETIVGAFVPLWERVLTDTLRGNSVPLRVPSGYERLEEGEPQQNEDDEDDDYDKRYEEWYENGRPLIMPEPEPYPGGRELRATNYSLKGRAIQVIVKLANILLVRLFCPIHGILLPLIAHV